MDLSGLSAGTESTWWSAGAPDIRPGPDAEPFAFTLARAADAASEQAKPREARVREAAEQLVAGAFVRPVLAQLRQTSRAVGPFAPGAYEKQFGALYDAEIADRLVKAAQFPIVDALARQLLEHSARAAGRVADPSAPSPAAGPPNHAEPA